MVGAGPTGALLALLLRRQGMTVALYEARPDPRGAAADSGRSINLALADRGIHALRVSGVFEQLGTALLPMRGRQLHYPDGSTSFQTYGQRPNEQNYSISRHRLNQALLEIAGRDPGIQMHFEHRLEQADFAAGTAWCRDAANGRLVELDMHPLIASDGAASRTRRLLAAQGCIAAAETDLDHGYKELSIPGQNRAYRMREDALHIWPRGNHMLIALPNEDGSFTATLFLPKHGAVSFEALRTSVDVERFLRRQFADAFALMPRCVEEFGAHPTGFLGTVSATPWHHRDVALLLGDAAHAIVPFHGQGMNCCFEDCIEFEAIVARHSNWAEAFAEFGALRRPNTAAIAAMALENYEEMRERVADPKFQLQHALALELERRFPARFVPRYSMVMFHHEIPYAEAQRRGALQAQILDELTRDIDSLEGVDFGRAAQAISARLAPL
jgi:kynurenine 3-monooxygenase